MKSLKITLLAALVVFTTLGANAQDKTKRIGNKPRSGWANSGFGVVKGNQVAIKMNAGRKPVQLLALNFDVNSMYRDSIPFKVNVYEYNEVSIGDNYVKQDIISYIPRGKNKVTVDLSSYNINVNKDLLVAIEWLTSDAGANPMFATGVLNGGTYLQENGRWKKVPVVGADFSMIVKKLK